jgi:hypothetical protein
MVVLPEGGKAGIDGAGPTSDPQWVRRTEIGAVACALSPPVL